LLNVQSDGTIDFTGFYGEYEVTIGGQTYTLDLTKGLDEYSLVVGPPSADFDLDGDVDGRDFLAWQRGYGTVDPTFGDGDANYDHQVDAADLAIWQAAYGTLPLTASVSVPEPGSLRILATAIVMVYSCQRRKNCSNLLDFEAGLNVLPYLLDSSPHKWSTLGPRRLGRER
jgi:hypothetical protein